jgi:hypothetical protein
VFVEYDSDIPPPRQHPWTESAANPDWKYCDFKIHPDRIPFVLEDFSEWSRYPATTTFFEMLIWLNGPDSILESNDCGLRPPRQDHESPEVIRCSFESDPTVIHARLAILFRDLAWNVSIPTINGLKQSIHDCLRQNFPDWPLAIKVGDWVHEFTALGKEGRVVTLRFWSWGDDEAMAMVNLKAAFDATFACLRWVSDGVKKQSQQPK